MVRRGPAWPGSTIAKFSTWHDAFWGTPALGGLQTTLILTHVEMFVHNDGAIVERALAAASLEADALTATHAEAPFAVQKRGAGTNWSVKVSKRESKPGLGMPATCQLCRLCMIEIRERA